MRKLSPDKRAAILRALVEGNSIASVCRIVGTSKVTVLRLLADAGTLCQQLQDQLVINIEPSRIEIDEVWAFVGAKDKNVPLDRKGDPTIGSAWTWVCLDPDSKLVIEYHVGKRDEQSARAFFVGLASRINSEPQITTDAYQAYVLCVKRAFGRDANYATIRKEFGRNMDNPETRYSPPTVKRVTKAVVSGNPVEELVSTSMVERQHRTLRMGTRRYTRLTDAFSKRMANHAHATALHYWFYNFARVHQTLKTTPALAAGVTDRQWTLLDLANLLERAELQGGSRLTEYLPSAK